MSKLPSLIEINNELELILNQIESFDGELTVDLELKLSEILNHSKTKVTGYVNVLNRFDNEIEFVKSQIKEANKYIDRLERQKEQLGNIALKVIEARGSKLEGENGHWIGTRKSTSVKIENTDLVPAIYSKIEVKLDKAMIKEDLQKGIVVPGASLETKLNINWK